MADFSATGVTNLVRHKSGNYYAQAKISGRKVRKSLKTKSKRVARAKLHDELERLRCEEENLMSFRNRRGAADLSTWSGILNEWLKSQLVRPDLKSNTRLYYERIAIYLGEAFNDDHLVSRISVKEAEEWWLRVNKNGKPSSVANSMLAAARKMMEIARSIGLRRDDPFEKLKRMSPPESELVVPTAEQVDQLIKAVRQVGRGHSEESADLIEFLAFTGMRIGEARTVEWKHIKEDQIVVTGGKEGTKSGKVRRVPIGMRVRELLNRRKWSGAKGPIFSIKTPREALNNACDRIDIPRLRVHDLRHIFATQAIEAGVDIPTVSKWLGHQDGGVLAMKTYGHVRDEHTKRMAKLIS